MTFDPESAPAFCSNGDGNPLVGEGFTGITVDVAVDEDGFCEVADLLCAECLTRETA